MNILITSAGRRAYIIDYFKACKGVNKVFASNSNYSIALKHADGFLISPLIYSNEYITTIIDFCVKKKIDAVLSLFDIDLLVLAKSKNLFEEVGVKLILAPVEFVEICNDKWKTYQYILSLGLKSPKTYLSYHDVIKALKTKEISFPLIVKPRWGMGSLSIYKAYNYQELIVFMRRSKKEIFDSYLKYESSMTAKEPILYQEFVKGKEYGIDIINDLQGNYINSFVKQKVAMRSGETDLGYTVDNTPFKDAMKKIADSSKHQGILSVDCIRSDSGTYIIEMNCRISGHYPLSYLAGMNYPQLIVDWLNNKPTNPNLLEFRTGLHIVKNLEPIILCSDEDIID